MKVATVRRFALSLPGVTEEPHFHLASFRVAGRIFVTIPPGQEHVRVFVTGTAREQALAMYPEFAEKLLWGGKLVGVQVTLESASPQVLKDLIREAWSSRAAGGSAGRRPGSSPARRKGPPRSELE